MEIFLGNKKYFVTGKKNAAIYDLLNKKIYELNEVAKNILIKYAYNQKIKSEEKRFIEKLKKNGLLKQEEMRINPTFKKEINGISFAWLELTNSCNLKCIHCYGEFGSCNSLNTMKKEDWKNVIDYLYKAGCRSIQLIGGEPLCFIDYKELIEYLRKLKFTNITIFTNATLIKKDDIIFLKHNNVNIRFSLYGQNEAIHDKITGIKGSFKKTVENVKLLTQNNIKVSVAVVIMKENEKFINEIRKFITENLKIKYNGYDVIRPSCVNENYTHRVKNIETLRERYYQYPRFHINEKQFFKNHFYNSCLDGKIAIASNGDVLPCIFYRDYVIGNVKEKNISEMMNEIEESWITNKNTIKECGECEYKYACFDCRPLAIGINGEKDSKYPRCCYCPEEGIWKDIKEITKELNILKE